MARREKVDRILLNRMANIEQRMNMLKLAYEKYFAGTDPIEPLKDREALKRDMDALYASSGAALKCA